MAKPWIGGTAAFVCFTNQVNAGLSKVISNRRTIVPYFRKARNIMPSESQAQHGFAAMSRTAAGRRKLREHGKKPMPVSAANDYMQADKGRKIGKLAKHVRKHS